MRSRRPLGVWGGAGPRGCLEFKGVLLRTDLVVLEVGPCASGGYLKGRILTVDFFVDYHHCPVQESVSFPLLFYCLPACSCGKGTS